MAVDKSGADPSFYILYVSACIFRVYDIFYYPSFIRNQYPVLKHFTTCKQLISTKLLVHLFFLWSANISVVLLCPSPLPFSTGGEGNEEVSSKPALPADRLCVVSVGAVCLNSL